MKDQVELHQDDLSDGQVIRLLEAHRLEMLKHSPPESVHALDIDAMRSQDLTFWSVRIQIANDVIACGALKHLDAHHAELKSMKVADPYLGKGLGRLMLNHLIQNAEELGYRRLNLETGTMDAFIAARGLYESIGFVECKPFADYFDDPLSICMTLDLA